MPEYRTIPLDQISEPPRPIRSEFSDEAIEELARSIQAEGLLQPIRVVQREGGYEVDVGHRRFLACRWLNWTTITALVLSPEEKHGLTSKLIENIQREDMSPLDEAEAVYDLYTELHRSLKATAHRLGKSHAWVRVRLRLRDLPLDLHGPLAADRISIAVALQLADISDPGWRVYYTHHAVTEGANAEKVSAWVGQWITDRKLQEAAGLPVEAPSLRQPPPEPLYPCWACRVPKPLAQLYAQHVCTECLAQISALAQHEP